MSLSDRQLEWYNTVSSFEQARAITLTKVSAGTYNPVTDVTSGSTSTNYDAVIVFSKASKDDSLPDDFQVLRGDRVMTYAGNGVIPERNDVITDTTDSITYMVYGATEASGGDNAVFTVYGKKGT